MKDILRRYWHIATAFVAAAWIAGSAVFGWVSDVEAFMNKGDRLTPDQANLTYVRKDVLNEQLRRIEEQLKELNKNFERHMERNHE